MELGGWEYVGVFAATLLLSLVLTPVALRFALRLDILDRPSEIKGHASPVPYLGGAAIVISFAFAVVAATIVRPPVSGRGDVFIVLALGVLLAIVGLLDDIRALSPAVRFTIEVAAGIAVWKTHAGASLTTHAVIDLPLTVL